VSPAKTAVLIQMTFGLTTQIGPRNHVIDGDPDPPWEAAISEKRVAHCKVQGLSAMNCAKMAEAIEMPLWDAESGEPKEARLKWGPDPPHRKGNYEGERAGPDMPDDTQK